VRRRQFSRPAPAGSGPLFWPRTLPIALNWAARASLAASGTSNNWIATELPLASCVAFPGRHPALNAFDEGGPAAAALRSTSATSMFRSQRFARRDLNCASVRR